MFLIESWRESLVMLSPKRIKVLLLVTAKCLSGLFNTPFAYAIIIPLVSGIAFNMAYAHVPALLIPQIVINIAVNIFIVLLLLLLRPSVMMKHRYYFMHYRMHMLYVLVFFGFINLIHLYKPLYLSAWLWFIWAPLSSFWFLFFIDSYATPDSFFRSFVRAFLLFFYNLPLVFVVTVCWYVVFAGLSQWPILFLARHIALNKEMWLFLSGTVVGFVLFPLWYTVITNIYVKQVHEQFSLYFGKPLS